MRSKGTTPRGGCVHTLLVRAGQHEVTYCSCGNVHVSCGSVTLRFLPDDYAVFTQRLGEAASALETRQGIARDVPGRLLM